MYDLKKISEIDRMYEEYFGRIYNYVFYRILHREYSEDIVSEIFLKVISNRDKFDSSKALFSTWIFTIANNCVIDHFRKNSRIVVFPSGAPALDTPVTVDFDGECEKILNNDRKLLYKALTLLDEKHRHVISLKYFSGLSNKEISEMTGINESTVSTICSRAISKLRSIFKTNENNF
ncbi:MAG: RNA polymerase sigma factor [Candidatus Wallbacteria bacterium]